MGIAYKCICKNCKEEYSIWIGSGALLFEDDMYVKSVREIKKGIWGKKYKRFFESEPYVVPNATREFYYCSNCGRWREERNMDLFVPKDVKALLESEYRKHFEYETDMEFLTSWVSRMNSYGQDQYFRCIHRRKHKCVCGNVRHKVSEKEMEEKEMLACPRCATLNQKKLYMYYD